MMRFLCLAFLVAVADCALMKAPLYKMKENIPGRYIVKTKDEISVPEVIDNLAFLEFLGGKIDRAYNTVKGFSAQLSDRALDFVRSSDQVLFVEEDSIVHIQEVGSWGLDRLDNHDLPMDDQYQPLFDGTGVNVYIIDTGITPDHDDVIGRAKVLYDTEPIQGNEGIDCNGHGSHCSGTAAGTVYGVAKNANIFGVRVLSCVGFGSNSKVVEGMDVVAERAILPAVASMSLGGVFSPATNAAVDSMTANGVVVVVAAGNSDEDACNSSPASAPAAVTVGATDSSDRRASFSNYGPCVDIFAPGVSITSIWIGDDNSSTTTISGTSMACPHVAGAAALILEENTGFTPAEVTAALLNTAAKKKVSDILDTPQNRLLQVKTTA